MPEKKSVRLPAHIKPERYTLMLKPDLEGFSFYGEETVELVIEKPTKEIILHAKDLEIEDVIFKISDLDRKPQRISFDKKSDTVTFTFNKTIPKGKGKLSLVFRGLLNDKLRGFYRSKYFVNGKEKYMATTQFESTDARRAFPCVDEPAAKAVFDVTLMIPPNTTAISNTIESKITEHSSGHSIVNFAPTPKMSTYLLAFIVGEFENIQAKTKRGVLVRVFVTPGKKHQAKFALDCAVKTLDFYEKYFDINYPLPVLDLIAIPDFAAGAMENWGAVTYRETALLVDPEHTSASTKQWVALVIAHELAHQWFGNLVTMEWWTHLWLNEGFASYIEYLAVDHLFPKWEIWTQFAYADLGIALKLDALQNTHPIEIEVHHPDEIGEIFDEVSYSKGSSVIRMLADYLGEKDFRDGLRYYLKKHAYANAATEDLWYAFEKISKKSVAKVMKNWTAKPGYPVIRLTEQKSDIVIHQSRFFSSSISKKQSKEKNVWQIPVSVMSKELRVTSRLLSQEAMNIPKSPGWVKINFGETGFFRTHYPAQMLAALESPIKNKKLPPIDRLGIVRDAYALAEAGEMSTVEALKLSASYINETDYTVWVELATGLGTLNSLLFGQKYYPEFQNYAKGIFADVAKRLGWKKRTDDGHTTTLLRNLALFNYGTYGDPATVKKAKDIFWHQKNISPDIRGLVYTLAAENGGKKEYDHLTKKYISEQMHEEKNRIGRALTAFTDKKLLLKTLEFGISKHVRLQDTASIVAGTWTNPHGRDVTWNFLKKNWKLMVERYGSGGYILARMLKAGGQMNTEVQAKDFEKFFKTHKAPGCARTIQQVLEKIHSNALWLKKDGEAIGRILMDIDGY